MDEWSRAPPQSPREEMAVEEVRVRILAEFIRFFYHFWRCVPYWLAQLSKVNCTWSQAFKMSRAISCTSGIVIVFRIVIQTKTAWKVHFSFMFWRCYCQLLFLSQLTQYWLILLILCSWSSKSVIIGLFHSFNWVKSWIFVYLFEF